MTAAAAEKVRPHPEKRLEIPDGGLPGLYLLVQPSGAGSWAVRYRHEGRLRKMTLGLFPVISLSEARAKAREALTIVSEGGDPAGSKQHRRNAETVASLVADFMARQSETSSICWMA